MLRGSGWSTEFMGESGRRWNSRNKQLLDNSGLWMLCSGVRIHWRVLKRSSVFAFSSDYSYGVTVANGLESPDSLLARWLTEIRLLCYKYPEKLDDTELIVLLNAFLSLQERQENLQVLEIKMKLKTKTSASLELMLCCPGAGCRGGVRGYFWFSLPSGLSFNHVEKGTKTKTPAQNRDSWCAFKVKGWVEKNLPSDTSQ